MEHTRTEEALREIEQRYQSLFERSKDAIFIADRAGGFIDVNPAALSMFDYPRDAMARLRMRDLVVEPNAFRFLRRIVRDGEVRDLDVKLRRRSGVEMDCVVTAAVRRDHHGRAVGYEGFVRDVTALRLANWGVRNLSAHLLRLRDEERRKLARELHDSTGQELAALGMNLAIAVKGSARTSVRARKALAAAQELADRCVSQIRTLSYLLHPPLLDERGLMAALQWLADGFQSRSGIRVSLELPADLGRLGVERETALFRIVQEALTNVHRHSGSAVAHVRLAAGDGTVVLEVQDEGRGMPTRSAQPSQGMQRLGVGITGMRERVRQLGGWLEVLSSRAGTTVRAVLPTVADR